jgi:transposase
MNHKQFVGIDISKETLDVFVYESKLHRQFLNGQKGFTSLLQWIKKIVKADDLNQVLFCLEHTGMYSLSLSVFLEENYCVFALISPLEIKRSLGITRGKNDKIDASRIAEYAYQKREQIKPTKLPSKSILMLHPLLTLRDRLARERGGFVATLKEQSRFLKIEEMTLLAQTYNRLIETLTEEIKHLEKEIKAIIKNDEQLAKTFDLITTIKGVGFLVATYLIVYTHNFTRFENWRKFACYSGIAPFEYQSGSSVRGRTKVNPIANHQIKKMLHLAALSSAYTDTEMIAYYKKRVSEGKSKMCTLNIIRNKLVARVFAVVKRGTGYVDLMKFAA